MITRRLPLALAVAAGVATAGCGGSSGGHAGEAEVKQTVQSALHALGAGDGRAFCALTTPAESGRLARTFAMSTCAAAMRMVGSRLTPAHRAALRRAEVSSVAVNGATATVAAADIVTGEKPGKSFLSDGGEPTRLRRTRDGRWLISG